MPRVHNESHRSGERAWLRAAVLGANDGIVSTASLILGFAASGADRHGLLLAGAAGLVGGAVSMAAGEFVSVSSQRDAEAADLAVERRELREAPESELRELAGIYVDRGLDPALAQKVAAKLMAHDALSAHARDELGMTDQTRARPLQAALASAAAFASGAAVPLLIAGFAPSRWLAWTIIGIALACLAVLGASAARMGGASVSRGAWRVLLWSALAMAATAAIGRLFGAA